MLRFREFECMVGTPSDLKSRLNSMHLKIHIYCSGIPVLSLTINERGPSPTFVDAESSMPIHWLGIRLSNT